MPRRTKQTVQQVSIMDHARLIEHWEARPGQILTRDSMLDRVKAMDSVDYMIVLTADTADSLSFWAVPRTLMV